MHPSGLKTRLHTVPVLFAALLWGVLEWAALSRVRWRSGR